MIEFIIIIFICVQQNITITFDKGTNALMDFILFVFLSDPNNIHS